MDSNKLKALKVVDLKAILVKANVQAPAKATKSDLISRILASKPAQDAYLSLYPPQDDLLAPPEEYFIVSLIASFLFFTTSFFL
jgi:SAP domain-containing ribonucleoprotein